MFWTETKCPVEQPQPGAGWPWRSWVLTAAEASRVPHKEDTSSAGYGAFQSPYVRPWKERKIRPFPASYSSASLRGDHTLACLLFPGRSPEQCPALAGCCRLHSEGDRHGPHPPGAQRQRLKIALPTADSHTPTSVKDQSHRGHVAINTGDP